MLYNEIKESHGATIKNNKIMSYKTGYQVAVNSKEKTFKRLGNALRHIQKNTLKNVGLWCDNGVWYLDTNSIRVSTKKEALELGKENHQIAIWDWKKSQTVYVN